jgi:hypothetical protein
MAKRKRHGSNRKPVDLVKAPDPAPDPWVWCLHCARCYPVGEYRQQGVWRLCPYPDCNGDTVLDAIPWAQRRQYHPEYPTVPDRDKIYPMG